MKKLILALLLSIPLFSNAQAGYINLNDFATPIPRSVFWLRGTTPPGNVPILTISGTNSFTVQTDTISSPKLALREDGTPNKLISIGTDGMFKAFTPTYLTGITSSDVTTALGYTPAANTRNITINGTTQDLTADRIYNVGDVLTTGSYSNPSWITSLTNTKITYAGTTSQYVRGDGSLATFPAVGTGSVTSVAATIPAGAISISGSPVTTSGTLAFTYTGNSSQYIRADGTATTFPTIPAAQVNSDWNAGSGVAQVLNKPTIPIYYHNGTLTSGLKTETFSATVAGGAGNAVVYLTDNGLITGNALYTNVNFVLPLVNDATTNYTYGYTISGDKKTLTINVKGTPALNIALLSLTLLGVPANVANGTAVTALVIGN